MDPLISVLGDFGTQLASINIVSIIIRLVLALIFSACVGWERAKKVHAAGLRTFMLVALAATGATLIDEYLMSSSIIAVVILAAATVIAIALISTYSIVYSAKSQIKGLTTSMALFSTGIMGMALGCGFYTGAILIFVFMIFILAIMPRLEKWLKDKSNHFEIHLELKNKTNLQDFVAVLRKLGMRIDDIESNPAYINSGLSVYTLTITITNEITHEYKNHKELIEALSSLDYVNYISEIQ